MMRIGLIGAGRWGKRYIETIARMDGVELAHLGSTNPASTQLVPSGCRVSSDWHDVACDRTLQGIILASPPVMHCEMALASINARIPILIEKPMTLSARDARAVVVAAASDVLVLTGHTHLFSSAFRALKAEATSLGRLLYTRACGGNRGPVRTDATVLWDWGPHDVAMSLDLFGSFPTSITALRIATQELPDGVGEAIEIHLGFAGGDRSEIRVSNIEPHKRRVFEAYFADGTLMYDDLAEHKLVRRNSPASPWVPIPVDPSLPLTNLVSEFCACIASKTSSHPSLELGVRAVEVLEHCQTLLARESAAGSPANRVTPCA